MGRLSRISGSEVVRALESLGFIQVRQTDSHVVMKKLTPERELGCVVPPRREVGEIGCVVPLRRELKVGTLSGVLRQAKVTNDQFIENL